MRRRLTFLAVAVLALTAAGIAVAAWGGGAFKTDPVSAEFSAERISWRERACTGRDGTSFRWVKAWFRGTATSSDSRLSGNARFRLELREDTTAGLGTVTGRMWINGGARARVVGVLANGTVNGLLEGHTRGGWLVANFTAAIDGSTLKGSLGGGDAANPAVIQTKWGKRACRARGKNGNGSGHRGKARLEVRKVLSPADDPGRFDLQIDGKTYASAAGNGGTTGERVVKAGTHTVGETARNGIDLDDYTISIACKDGNGEGSTVASGNARTLSLRLAENADVVCVVTNTRTAGTATGKIELKKDLSPPDDPGRFKLFVKQGATTIDSRSDAGDNDSTGENTVPTGTYQVSESADEKVGGGLTSLGDYSARIECRKGNGSGDVVASNTDGQPLSVVVGAGDDVVCVITNTKKTPATGKLEVRKDLSPSDDPGRFKLFLKQGATTIDSRSDAGDNDSTGENTVPTGTYQVSEGADEKVGGGTTQLSDYDTSIQCRDGNGGGDVVAGTSSGQTLGVAVGENEDVVCVITNTRKPT
jgi:hypothetical protein